MKRMFLAPLVLALAVGCSGGDGEQGGTTAQQTAKQSAEAPAAVTKVDMATAGTITGSVAFKGTAPKMQIIDVSSEPTCQAHAQTSPVSTQTVVVNDNGTLRYVFVHITKGLEGMTFSAPDTPVTLDQNGCKYEPHVFGIQAGQPLLIKNSDEGVLHNIHAFSKQGNAFNFGMPKVMESTREFRKPEVMVTIKCDVHSWMHSFAGVVDNPYYGVTGEDGSFKLAPLPPGEYTVEAWHEEYGVQTQTVTVGAKETKEITFTFQPAS